MKPAFSSSSRLAIPFFRLTQFPRSRRHAVGLTVIYLLVVQWTSTNVPKVSCTHKALVLLIEPIVFDVLIAVLVVFSLVS